jgi:hypothetical protein
MRTDDFVYTYVSKKAGFYCAQIYTQTFIHELLTSLHRYESADSDLHNVYYTIGRFKINCIRKTKQTKPVDRNIR